MKTSTPMALLCLCMAFSAAAAESLPSVDQILARNIEALGGQAALEKVRSRTMKGKLSSPAVGEVAWELLAKAPNKRLSVLTVPAFGTMREGFDGQVAWTESPQNGLKEKQGEELARARRESEFDGELHRKRQFPWMSVKGKERVQNRDVYVIEARPADGGPELLYFDTRSGLMVRREFDVVGASGTTQMQFDFDDYRAVEGVKFPFVTKMPKPEIVQFTLTLTEVKLNAPVEDKVFEKPAAK